MSRVIPYVMRPERQREVRYVPPKTPPSPRPATRSPGGPLCGCAAAPSGQHDVHSPQSCFAASTTGKNQYVRPRAPCTSAPPHADGGKWGGLDRDVFSRAAAARCLGSSEGCPARPVVSLRVDGRPIPAAFRHRHVLERLWSERSGRRPPWDLLRLPTPRRICTAGTAAAAAAARSSAPGGSLPVVPRECRSRRAAWTGGPSRRLCARFTLRCGRAPGGVAGSAAGLLRGRPACAPRRHAARRSRPGAFHFSSASLRGNQVYNPLKKTTFQGSKTGHKGPVGRGEILGFNARVLFSSFCSLLKATTTRKLDSRPESDFSPV